LIVMLDEKIKFNQNVLKIEPKFLFLFIN
jgi:hypothetical protein